jgi:UDP-glucose 4-epimerase
VDTVVHTALNSGSVLGRSAAQEQTITGTMQLLAACQRSDTVRHIVIKSTTAVYGASSRDPAVFTEDMHAVGHPARGYAHDAVEVENHVRGFLRRRPDIAVTVLRLGNLVGAGIDTALTRYLTMPVVPSPLGFDPRLQLLYETDAVEALAVATLRNRPGVYNVAGDGVLMLSQALRRGGRWRLPVPGPALSFVGALVRNVGVLEVSAEQSRYLNFGRVVDTTRLKTELGFSPRYSTDAALRACLLGAGEYS